MDFDRPGGPANDIDRRKYVAALRTEREYVASLGDQPGRVEAIDAEIARFEEKPQGRRRPPRETT